MSIVMHGRETVLVVSSVPLSVLYSLKKKRLQLSCLELHLKHLLIISFNFLISQGHL